MLKRNPFLYHAVSFYSTYQIDRTKHFFRNHVIAARLDKQVITRPHSFYIFSLYVKYSCLEHKQCGFEYKNIVNANVSSMFY